MVYISNFFSSISKNFKDLYLTSNFYDRKISKIINSSLVYKPSPHLLSSLIKYQKKRFRIEDYSIEKIWDNKNIKKKDFKKLNSFYWFFNLDLKSSKEKVHLIIKNWIIYNCKYNSKSWEFDLTAKRIISWLSCHNLSFDGASTDYKNNFNLMVKKQTNHLINEINKSKSIDDKLIGCASIILAGLCYKNEKNYLSFGLDILKKISKLTLDGNGFPKSRNVKQLIFYLKYFILIREWFKESQISIPEYIDENIYYLGQGYNFSWQNTNYDLLFNGNNISGNNEFDSYLKRFGYKFINTNFDFGGYFILKNKKICLIMDAGNSPISKYTKDYQAGALSFEIISNQKKLITNCGYYSKENTKLNELSKSTAMHNTLIIDDNSSCKFKKVKNSFLLNKSLKVLKRQAIFEKNYWKVTGSHDGYLKKYNSIHERKIEFFPEKLLFLGFDKIIKKKINYNYKFDIRFHTEPNVKLMKTQDGKYILIQLEDEGWKFSCENFTINIDNGLYFGNKNSYTENQNIFISGISNNQIENIKWKLEKIQ
tara:strand:+ start:1217 stop:2830 length:1614 start_codon:yes stop_codon:yes gene_type:complete